MDFLSSYYKDSFLSDSEKIKELVERLPNKELSQAILDAIGENRFLNGENSSHRFYSFERIDKISVDNTPYNREAIYRLTHILHMVPSLVWYILFVVDGRTNLEISYLTSLVEKHMDADSDHLKMLIEELRKYNNEFYEYRPIGCPWMFIGYEPNSSCEVYKNRCQDCWHSTINKTFYGQ